MTFSKVLWHTQKLLHASCIQYNNNNYYYYYVDSVDKFIAGLELEKENRTSCKKDE